MEIVRKPGSGDVTLYFHSDHQGTPETISDQAQNVTQQTFGAFGDPLGAPPTLNGATTRIGYTGHEQDDDLGLTDMGGRVYDPLSGRFTTADPIMQAPFWSQGHNRYAYVFNDPINLTDPSGFMSGGRGTAAAAFGITFAPPLAAACNAYCGGGAPAGSLGGSIAGGGINLFRTFTMSAGGPAPNTSWGVAAPSAAPTSTLNKVNSPGSAAGAAQMPGVPRVQERASLFEPARGALVDASDSDSVLNNPFLKFEHKLDSSFKPVGPVELGDFSVSKAPGGADPLPRDPREVGPGLNPPSEPRRTLDPPGPDEVSRVWDQPIKQKYLDNLSKLNPSPETYLLDALKPTLKAHGSRVYSQVKADPSSWPMAALVGGGLATAVVVAAVTCSRDGVDCSFK